MKQKACTEKNSLIYSMKKFIWVFVIIASVVWGIGKNDPFGISDVSDEKVNGLWIKWEEMLFPRNSIDSSTVVVIFDDGSFEAIQDCKNGFFEGLSSTAWPLVYADYANITHALLSNGKAKIVFWDVYFKGIRKIDPTWKYFLQSLEDIVFDKGQVVGFGFDLRVKSKSQAIIVANSLVKKGVILTPLNNFGTSAVYDVKPEITGCEEGICRQGSVPYAIKKMGGDSVGHKSKILMKYSLPKGEWWCGVSDSCDYMSHERWVPVYRIEELCGKDKPFGFLMDKVVLVGYNSSSDLINVPVYGFIPGVLYQAIATELYWSGSREISDRVVIDLGLFSLSYQGVVHIVFLIPMAILIVVARKKFHHCCDGFGDVSCLLVMPMIIVFVLALIFMVRGIIQVIIGEEVLPVYTVSSFFVLIALVFDGSCKVFKIQDSGGSSL